VLSLNDGLPRGNGAIFFAGAELEIGSDFERALALLLVQRDAIGKTGAPGPVISRSKCQT
jgi:hypothetical protein